MADRSPPTEDRHVVPADPAARRAALWWMVLAVLAAIAVFLFLAEVAADLDSLATQAPDRATERAAQMLEVSLGIAAALALLAAAWIARLATRILEAGRYPLPDARLTRDTPLRTGPAARRIAWLGFVCAGVLALAAVGLIVTGWRLLAMLGALPGPAGSG